MQETVKVRDINPPKKFSSTSSEIPRWTERDLAGTLGAGPSSRNPWIKKGAVVLAGTAAFGALTAQLFFTSSELVIVPNARSVTASLELEVRPQSDAAEVFGDSVLPGLPLSSSVAETAAFPATGSAADESRARGVVRVYNAATTSPYTLIANTRFVSEGGMLFRAPERIVIPGASWAGGRLQPGTIDIEIVAAEAGSEYNIAPASFSLPGLAGTANYTAVYAKSSEGMKGGGKERVAAVTREDRARGEDLLVAKLKARAEEDLLAKLPRGNVLLPDAVFLRTEEVSTLAKEGARLKEFDVSATVVGEGLAFERARAENAAEAALLRTLSEEEILRAGSLSVSYEVIRWDRERGVLKIRVTGSAAAVRLIDETDLKVKIRGRTQEEVRSLLEGREDIAEHSLSFSPFWVSKVPRDLDRISLQVRDGASLDE